MKFYTSQLEYDEIYYDTRTRIETASREENETSWGGQYAGCYIAVSKVTMTMMTIVAAVEDNLIEEKNIICYMQTIIEHIAKNIQNDRILYGINALRLKEVTLNAFMTVIKDNALNKLFSDKELFLEKIGISEHGKCFKEYLLDKAYWDKEKCEYESNIVPKKEKERIAEGKEVKNSIMQPVQYVLFESDLDIAKLIIQELLHYLCLKGRVSSRRIVKIEEEDYIDVLMQGKIQNLSNLDGGVVVVCFRKTDDSNKIKGLLSSIYDGGNNYSNKYTAMVVFPDEKKEYSEFLLEYCPHWAFVPIINKSLKRKDAEFYFQELLMKNEIQDTTNSWKQMFEIKDNYTKAEVLELYKMWYRNVYNISNNFKQYSDIVAKYFQMTNSNSNAREELQKLIGLNGVKKVINELVDYFKLQKKRNEKDNKITRPTMHMVFYGNPGTAKTTVARLVGKILKEERILAKGDFYEVGRADLVGKYVGWTAQTVKEYFEKARESVLFIDEAYALVDGDNSFGDEAINTIVQEMENHREDVVVIMAGYKAAMEKLLNKNQGLSSRVSFYIEFPDYTAEELYCILEKMVVQEGYILEDGVKEFFLGSIVNVNLKDGNGRLARRFFERAKIRQASRVLKLPVREQKKEMMIMRCEDFVN